MPSVMLGFLDLSCSLNSIPVLAATSVMCMFCRATAIRHLTTICYGPIRLRLNHLLTGVTAGTSTADHRVVYAQRFRPELVRDF